MIAVLAVISILIAVGAGMFRFGGESAKLRSGFSQVELAFEGAGQRARSRGERMRVAVFADASDPERYLRQFGVAELAGESESGEEIWRLTAPPQMLETGLFFDPGRSDPGLPDGAETMLMRGPEGSDLPWWFFEFDGAGAFRNPGARVVLALGVPGKVGEEPLFPTPESADGFLVTAAGRTLRFENPDQMKREEVAAR